MLRRTRTRPVSLLATGALTCVAMACAMTLSGPARAADSQGNRGADIAASTLDLTIVRPLATAKVIVGAALFVPAALLSAPMGREGVSSAYDTLVSVPAEFAFSRKIGEF